MVRKIKMVGRLPRTLGLTVTAMLVFGVVAANAQALSWYAEGFPIEGEKPITLKGPDATFAIHSPSIGDVKCGDIQGTGVIKAPAGGSALLSVSECKMVGSFEWCEVQPFNLNVTLGLTEKSGKIVETITPPSSFTIIVKDPYEGCAWWKEKMEFTGGGQLGVEFPKGEAVVQTVTGLKEYKMSMSWGKEANQAYLEGPMTQQITWGEKFGVK